MKITFLGAAREVTGSCILLESAKARVLIDCGLFQGGSVAFERNIKPFGVEPATLDAVILTHAHIDHIGRFPKLVKEGFGGRAFVTHPTRLLAKQMWMDAEHVMRDDARRFGKAPIYGQEDVWKAYDLLHGVEYGTPVRIADDITFHFRDAGHIFGSAFVEMDIEGKRLVCSGDIGNENVPILRPTEPMDPADIVIMESTYGDRVHEDPRTRSKLLKKAVVDTVKRRGVLMIPAFSLERTQEILYELNEMVEGGQLPRVPIFLDSPLAIKVLPIYHRFPEYYNRQARELSKTDDFFQFPGLQITRKAEQSLAIASVPPPKVIIAGSGMMHGGRIMHHLVDYLNNPNNTLLIVGFQATGTIGREVLEGANRVHIDHEEILVKAKVEAIGAYSAHGDQLKLLNWLVSGKTKPKKVYLDHGEISAMEVLAGHIRQGKKIETVLPEFGVAYEE
jgi:metallo-beta-lactamase family protein